MEEWMFSHWGPRARAHLRILLLIPTTTAPPSFAQASPPHPKALHFRDSTHVAAVACEVAAAARPKGTSTRCRVEAFRETPGEFIVRLLEIPLAPPRELDFPRSEVRLQKDGTGAVLTRIPEL
jgi:hypothetical protein